MSAVEPAETSSLPLPGPAPDLADAAQRKLAAIWKAHPANLVERRTSTRDPSRELQDELCDRLSAELGERSEALGADDPQTIDVQLQLAEAQLEAGRAAEAIALLERGIAALDAGDSSLAGRRAGATAVLAEAYLRTRRPQLAIALYESLLTAEHGASARSQLLGYRIKLAVAHRATGNVTATVDQLHALSDELDGVGADTYHLLHARVELANTNVVAGRPLDAVTLYESALPLSTDLHGAEHRTTLGIRVRLARAHQQAGQSTDAIRVYEQLVTDAGRALGPNDRLTVQTGSELAVLLRAQR